MVFRNEQSHDLFGKMLPEPSSSVDDQSLSLDYMNLPLFVEIDAIKASSVNQTSRLDELRTSLKAAMDSSTVKDCHGLLSLTEILRKKKSETDKEVSEQYLLISLTDDDSSDGQTDNDRHIIV